ncbi:hypothetical protein ACT7C1_27085 [Bacillus paranthracis]
MLQAVPTLIYSYLGFEICFFLYPFFTTKKSMLFMVLL